MRLSELEGKEIVNLHNGGRLGLIDETEMVFNPNTGSLESILIPNQQGMFGFGGRNEELIIPWESVVKIGDEIVIVNLSIDAEDQLF
ncbi:sporulation protein, YlmC/YmxH family [Halobacteroides halobius DSM 5150]|uniref:Sporulation protein, YlmC/YmxH family n=1 Tax=Halobacteroides halobius (strain ATCC 35273 / DSM 5150 / MD-1) TaxID=748449 RepID=L0K6N7_HALHC|nr:YlmC/YmxH family sporulation protein [Halobacteroides halobius]AGB40691.1 sporulation protein, YlmC/YmxH family [Halobacteroides halobius DSM 5150]